MKTLTMKIDGKKVAVDWEKNESVAALTELVKDKPLTEFRETDWLAMVDYITVQRKNDIRVTFKDGTEIKA